MWGSPRQSVLLLDNGWISPPSLRLPPLCDMTRGNNASDTSCAWLACTSSRTSTWRCGTNCRPAMPRPDGPLAWKRLTSSSLRTLRSAEFLRTPSLACPWSRPCCRPRSRSSALLVNDSLLRSGGSARPQPWLPARCLSPPRGRGTRCPHFRSPVPRGRRSGHGWSRHPGLLLAVVPNR